MARQKIFVGNKDIIQSNLNENFKPQGPALTFDLLSNFNIDAFFLVGAVLFFTAIFSIRESTFLKSKYNLKVNFKYVEGLRSSSPVRFCGVDIGEVDKVDIIKDKDRPYVCVYIKVDNDVKIPKESFYFINSLSLFGQKYLEITPPAHATGEYMSPGQEAQGLSPTPLFNTFNTFDETMQEVSKFVREGSLKSSLEEMLLNLKDASKDMKDLLEDAHSSKGTIGKLFSDPALYDDINELVVEIKTHPWKLLYKPKDK